MKIEKYLSLAEFIVSPDEGKIWVNAPDCILRIQGVHFIEKKEKFSMIDINGDKAYMYEKMGDDENTYIIEFIEKILSQIIYNNLEKEHLDRILDYTTSICEMEKTT